MFRVAQPALRARTAVSSRSLASSVLLLRSWQHESVAQLRREAKARGLASTGTKEKLVQRLTEFGEKQGTPAARRTASTASTPDPDIFNIKLPDLYQPIPQLEAQVPYVPDFWASTNPEPIVEGSTPKLLVVAGAATHHGGGPSHSLLPEEHEPIILEESQQATAVPGPGSKTGGVFFDIAQDLGFLTEVPAASPARRPFWQLFG